jgi:hypothetical protein
VNLRSFGVISINNSANLNLLSGAFVSEAQGLAGRESPRWFALGRPEHLEQRDLDHIREGQIKNANNVIRLAR